MLYYRRPKEPVAAAGVERSDALNSGLVLAVFAGVAIATQVVVNSIGLRDLGIGSLVGISGFATGVIGLGLALSAERPEITSKALACAAVSGCSARSFSAPSCS